MAAGIFIFNSISKSFISSFVNGTEQSESSGITHSSASGSISSNADLTTRLSKKSSVESAINRGSPKTKAPSISVKPTTGYP